jgi:protein gp37
MSKQTSIQYAHSSANWQMGCDGCELWNARVKKCYAGKSTRGMEGNKGWPERFEAPKLFLERVEPTLKWGPPTPAEREAKPWIPDDYPRIIFLNDMGDTFSAKLPLNWMAPFLPRIKASPHQFLVLTKRPSQFVKFAEQHPLPPNLWPGTTFTADATVARIRELRKIQSGGPKWVSFEPLWSAIPHDAFDGIAWSIFGGESGPPADQPTPFRIEDLVDGMARAESAGCKRFVKQLGSRPVWNDGPIRLNDFHGGDWSEWPIELQIREFPDISRQSQTSLL